ncbi:MAG: arylsulfatase [Sphingomonadaceae bacterium]
MKTHAINCARLVAASLLLGAAPAPKQPNIVILLADDWGFTDVGAFGGEVATPAIDALAMAGVRFSNFHVAGSCAPTRAMLQTGISNHRAGLGNMPETIPPEHRGKPGYDMILSDNVVTMAQLLRDGGYRTYLTGKWHLGSTPDKLPTARGYDHAFSLAHAGADNFADRPIEGLNDQADWTEDGKSAALPKDFYSSRFIVDTMIRYIDQGRASGKPFFASVNFQANHTPVQAPDAYIARYANRYASGWSILRRERAANAAAIGIVPPKPAMAVMGTTKDWATLSDAERTRRVRAMAAYAGMAEAMDEQVGRLVAHLKASGEYDNTIFVFLSDNGAEAFDATTGWLGWLNAKAYYDLSTANMGRRNSFTAIGASWASAAASPLRGYKFTASEGGLRVPLIMAWPGNRAIKPGRIAPRFTHVTDLAPTLLAAAGIAPTGPTYAGRPVERMAGANLLPVLTGVRDSARRDDQPLGYELSGNAALFKGDYKLVKNLAPTGDGSWKLYNIVRDPGEAIDLTQTDVQRAHTMQADYSAFAKADQVLSMPPGYQSEQQIIHNALHGQLIPKLWRLVPWLLIGLAVGIAFMIWRRTRQHRAERR